MNGKYSFTSAIAILAMALVGYTEASKNIGVVSVGPLVPTVATPSVRVTNDRPESVEVSFVAVGAEESHRLGSVSARATETFAIPKAVRTMRIVVQAEGKQGKEYVTDDIPINLSTDVNVQVGDDLDLTTVEVAKVEAVRPHEQRRDTFRASEVPPLT